MSIEKIRDLLELMESHELSELELEEGDFKLRLAKKVPVMTAVPAAPMPVASAAPAAAAPAAPAAAEEAGLVPIPSPIVGTFYKAPAPDADPFVKPGDNVSGETVVCIIEAMKVMNEVKAGVSGSVVKTLVENGEAVEYGQPLFMVRPN